MVAYSDLVRKLNKHIKEINRLNKCLKKKQVPQTPTKSQHISGIVTSYNIIASLLKDYYSLCTEYQKTELTTTFLQLREKVLKLFEYLKLGIVVPLNFDELIEFDSFDVIEYTVREENCSYDFDLDLEFEEFVIIMANEAANAKSQWINAYSKVIPEFDGTPENMARFVDACELVDDNVGIYMETAVRLMKTKLRGTARSYVTNEATITAILDVLKKNVRGESSKAASAKLLSFKQGNKSPNDYVKELEDMTANLKRAYLNEGVPVESADSYSTDTVVKSIIANATNDKIKTVFQSADFKSVVEVGAKFINANNEMAINRPQILYNKRFGYQRGNNRGQRSNNYRGYGRNNQGRGNSNGYNNGYNNQGSSNNFANYGNRNNYSQRGNQRAQGRNVRYAENSQAPQMTLGVNSSTSSQ